MSSSSDDEESYISLYDLVSRMERNRIKEEKQRSITPALDISSSSSDWDEDEDEEEEEIPAWLRADIKTSSSLKEDARSSCGRDGRSRAELSERGNEEKDLSTSIEEDQKKPETREESSPEGLGGSAVGDDSVDFGRFPEEPKEFLVKNHSLKVRQGPEVELVDVDKFCQLTDRIILAPLLCGFLNTTHGGKMFLGVKRTGLIMGITLDRKKRDLARQLLDRIINNNIQPRVAPEETEVDFVRVMDRANPQLELQVMIISVAGRPDGVQRFAVAGLEEVKGVYTRQGGDQNNVLLQ